MKYKPPSEESIKEMLEALKPLGFVGNGRAIRRFTHTALNRSFDLTACTVEGALNSVVVMAFEMGVTAGIEHNQAQIRENLGL